MQKTLEANLNWEENFLGSNSGELYLDLKFSDVVTIKDGHASY